MVENPLKASAILRKTDFGNEVKCEDKISTTTVNVKYHERNASRSRRDACCAADSKTMATLEKESSFSVEIRGAGLTNCVAINIMPVKNRSGMDVGGSRKRIPGT